MAVADTESVLDFVNKHYPGLKREAEEDNKITPAPKKGEITAVIKLIDDLLKTVLDTTTSTHDTIVGQLKALGVAYEALKLPDIDTTYTRYNDAFESLNMIVDGLEEVAELEPASGSTASGSTASIASTASGPVMSPSAESALVSEPVVSASRELVLSSRASTASGPESTASALVPYREN
jgi:hypothetical protein